MRMRFIDTGTGNAFANMATDEILMESEEPVLRVYSWQPPAVSLGYFQKVDEEIDEDACGRMGIDIIRRQTGGGAVFHDKELTYSIVLKEYPKGILDSYKLICFAVIDGLETLGIKAEFAPLNDILVGGKKISGCAQTRKKGVLLQHGTLLLGLDVDRMFEILRIPDEKLKGKLISDAKARVSSIGVSYEDAAKAIKRGFEIRMGAEFFPSVVSRTEREKAAKLADEKYRTKGWLYRI
jgi:lipoate-protein ligase A